MKQQSLFHRIVRDNLFSRNVAGRQVTKPVAPVYVEFPKKINALVKTTLIKSGISQLYSHQKTSFLEVTHGKNVVISSGVDSGKSLCYQLPIINNILTNPSLTALLLFPTKALAQDQKDSFSNLLTELLSNRENNPNQFPTVAIYDGDTANSEKRSIRENGNIVITNPDMLHLGILPHHTKWQRFFSELEYIVIDEVHVYRGIFGSHFANVIRRLKRILLHYHSHPRFIVTSATLSNKESFINKLLEVDFQYIDQDGAPHGKQDFVIYNPPIINSELGIRRNAMLETIRIAEVILNENLQTLIFAQSRPIVEMILTYLRENEQFADSIKGYRSGYLPTERRSIEQNFRDGSIRMIAATNALELGIDIGDLDIVIINGYPGSIISMKQQAGRAGRKGKPSLIIFVASSNLLDQYLVKHPSFLLNSAPESALIDPNNPFILFNHLQCAVFEKPFSIDESFGNFRNDQVLEYLQLIEQSGIIYSSNNIYYWISNIYPANKISLRTANNDQFTLSCDKNTIGVVDQASAYWFTHPEAIYLHNGVQYYVEQFDFNKKVVKLTISNSDYFTKAKSKSEFQLLELLQKSRVCGGEKLYGQIKVKSQITGYKKLKWHTGEILGHHELDLPKQELITMGYWFVLDLETVKKLKDKSAWNNQASDYGSNWAKISAKIRKRDHYTCQNCGVQEMDKSFDVHHKIPLRSFNSSVEANRLENLVTLCVSCHRLAEQQVKIKSGLAGISYLLGKIAPLFLMCDNSDIRVQMEPESKLSERLPTIIFFDSVPGGIGLSLKLYEIHNKLLLEGLSIVAQCKCDDGCPACVGPVAENGIGAKKQTIAILTQISSDNQNN